MTCTQSPLPKNKKKCHNVQSLVRERPGKRAASRRRRQERQLPARWRCGPEGRVPEGVRVDESPQALDVETVSATPSHGGCCCDG